MVKVSVIVPVYKVPLEYLKECFDSLINQTLQESEFIIVSDGAPGAECSICDEFASKDYRIKFYRKDHTGVSATRNYGINKAQGEYITFVDSDDWIEPNCCKELYIFAKQQNADVVLFDYIPDGVPFNRLSYGDANKSKLSQSEINKIQQQCINLTDDHFVAAVSTICKFSKRKLFLDNDIHFAEHIKRCEDRPVSYKTFEFSQKTSYLKKSFYHYRSVDTSITHTLQDTPLPTWLPYLTQIKMVSEKYSDLIGNLAISYFLSSLGNDYFCKKNKNTLFNKIRELKKIIKSKDFQWTIQKATIEKQSKIPFIIKFDSFFIRHELSFPVFLHGIKWAIFDRK